MRQTRLKFPVRLCKAELPHRQLQLEEAARGTCRQQRDLASRLALAKRDTYIARTTLLAAREPCDQMQLGSSQVIGDLREREPGGSRGDSLLWIPITDVIDVLDLGCRQL